MAKVAKKTIQKGYVTEYFQKVAAKLTEERIFYSVHQKRFNYFARKASRDNGFMQGMHIVMDALLDAAYKDPLPTSSGSVTYEHAFRAGEAFSKFYQVLSDTQGMAPKMLKEFAEKGVQLATYAENTQDPFMKGRVAVYKDTFKP